ncbi:MAG: hypothetical protein ACO3WU_09635 [Ilumatobacteraceae bacterium]
MFRLFGFDVHVRTGFGVFLVLVVAINPNAFGLWVAAGIAAFTLVHEFGHALVARSFGAEASISLDFLAGYTSFRPRRPLDRPRQAAITAAGPLTQIITSSIVLLALGTRPWSYGSVDDRALTEAIWWAGPAIGLLNLVPVLPLDGGHLVRTALQPWLGRDSMRTMAIVSIVLTGCGAVLLYVDGRRGFTLFIAFLLITQFQMLQAGDRRQTALGTLQRSAEAERQAWESGRPGILEPGQRISPWFEAHRALSHGDEGGAIGVMLADLRASDDRRWMPPTAASPEQLRAIVAVLPDELPDGNEASARVFAEVLIGLGEYRRAGTYAARAFTRHRLSSFAVVVARAAAATDDPATSLQWIDAAIVAAGRERPGSLSLVTRVLDRAPEFDALRPSAEFEELRLRTIT